MKVLKCVGIVGRGHFCALISAVSMISVAFTTFAELNDQLLTDKSLNLGGCMIV